MRWDHQNLFVIAGFVGGLIIVCSFFLFTGRWAYSWGLISEGAGVATGSLRYSLHPLGEVCTPLYKPYRYMPPQRVWFLRRFGLNTGIHFAHFGVESSMY